jgi:hypothetical protein
MFGLKEMAMKNLLFAFTAATLVAPAVAQAPPPAHSHATPATPATPAASSKSMDMSKMTPEQKRQHCSEMMSGNTHGHKMTDAKMKEMQDKCKGMMKTDATKAAPAKP